MNPELLRRLTAHARWLAARHPTDLATATREAVPRLRVRAGHADVAALGAALVAAVVAVAVAAVPIFRDEAAPQAASSSTRHTQATDPYVTDSASPLVPPSLVPPSASRSRSKPPSASRSAARPGPFVLRVRQEGVDAVRLSWQRPSGFRVTRYEVWRSGRLYTRLDGDTTGYRMGKLREGEYQLYVVATGTAEAGNAESRRSNAVTVTIDSPRTSQPPTASPTPSADS